MRGMGFKMGSRVKILSRNEIGHIIDVKRDKNSQPVYLVQTEGGCERRCYGYELDASLEHTGESIHLQQR